jgi:GT2 family glycosyltransferase
VKLHLSEKNGGFAKTCNQGITLSGQAADIVLLNTDIICHDYWLDRLQQAAYESPDIGLVGPKLLYPCGTIQSAGIIQNPDAPDWFDHSYRHYPANYPAANLPSNVLAITGACLYIKRPVIDRIGLLDENFEMAFEDVDFCLRATQAGFVTTYCPSSVLAHLESMSRGLVPTRKEEQAKQVFWKKWDSSAVMRHSLSVRGISSQHLPNFL